MKINELFTKENCNDVYVIAEISQNHDGSLGQAHAFIDACAHTGVDAIKFQTHIADAESTPDEPFRVKFSYEDKTRYDYWKRMEFTEEQWIGLKEHAENSGMEFLSSPFSKEAFLLLDRIGIPAWKLGSGEVFNSYLLDLMIKTGKPILLSSGMSTYEDIRKQTEKILRADGKYAIFQCITSYPAAFNEIGINVIDELQRMFECPVGLSDHSGTIYPALVAAARGARLIEVHTTMSKYMFGPDVSSSVTIEELTQMVEGVRAISQMFAHPINKGILDDEHKNLKNIFAKGIYLKRDIQENDIIEEADLCMKKPLQGISAENYLDVIGRRAKKNLKQGQYISKGDFDE